MVVTEWRDPVDQILAVLQREGTGLTVGELVELTGRARSTVTNNLAVMHEHRSPAWVARTDGRPTYWRLTGKGREVARFRVRTAKREDR